MELLLDLLELQNIFGGILLMMIVLRLFEKIRQKKLGFDNFEFGIYKGYFWFFRNRGFDEKFASSVSQEYTNLFLQNNGYRDDTESK